VKLAVISDIHGNIEALNEVLGDVDRRNVDQIVSLGDNIGYGPEPEAVIETLCDRGIPSILGNHELAVKEPAYLEWFNPLARKSHIKTRECLSPQALDYCRGLPPTRIVQGCLCVHGCPPDSTITYIFELSRAQLARIFDRMDERICFVGHTHRLEIIAYDGGEAKWRDPVDTAVQLDPDCQHIINAGSVGQPRDGDNRAKYVIWDTETYTLTVRRVPYDIKVTADRIIELGWPEFYARRLW